MLARIYRQTGDKLDLVATCGVAAATQPQAEEAVGISINRQAIRTAGTYFVATETSQLFKVDVHSKAQVVTQLYVGPESD